MSLKYTVGTQNIYVDDIGCVKSLNIYQRSLLGCKDSQQGWSWLISDFFCAQGLFASANSVFQSRPFSGLYGLLQSLWSLLLSPQSFGLY